jgi:hypothetical protein
MTQTLLLFAGAWLLAVSAATLFVAVRTLRTARRYVDLAEERLEHLSEGQTRLLAHLEEQRRSSQEGREVAELGVRTRRGAERSIERTKQELLERRAVRRPPAEAPEARERPEGTPPEGPPEARKAQRPVVLPETRSPETAGTPNEDEQPRRAVWRPHPDDDIKPGSTLAGRARASGGFPIRMFRVFYDRYLDNYEGYVKLAERIHRTRTHEEMVPGSRAERGWQERLRRVNDGIERTTERLDILEHSNPELASDDRVSRRAGIARSHSQIAR